MLDVPGRVSSLRFVGRGQELEQVESAFKAAAVNERSATVLIGGEAGVGKTRLVTELAARVRAADGLVLKGSCLELANQALPFGPIVQALRALPRAVDAETLDAVIGPAGDTVGRLVPEVFNGAERDPASVSELFEQLLGLFERLGERVPTLLVLEDLHWADHSTRDLLVFLARNLADARVLVVGTYRSDDLHRRHPLRSVLAELDRAGVVQHLSLGRFNREETAEMMASILDTEPTPALVESTFERSDGNAFYTEELLAARGRGASEFEVPDELRAIVLTRIDALSQSARSVLPLVAVLGSFADHRLVAALAEMPEAELFDGLRDAIDHQVLVTPPDGLSYQFRHTLVREAVYDDMLPGERVQLHARVAELMAEHPEWCGDGAAGALAGELAGHWYAAHDARRALIASLDAARAAEHMCAYPEALSHVERALELWPLVPDADEASGVKRLAVLQAAAAQAHHAGDPDRAIKFIASALGEAERAGDVVTAGLLHEHWARCARDLGAPANELLEHVNLAVNLVPADKPAARARVLATQGQQLMLAGYWAEAIKPCEEAIALAQARGDGAIVSHARNTMGISLAALGEQEAGLAQIRRARAEGFEAQSLGDIVRAYVNESSTLFTEARYDEALTIALEGVEQTSVYGFSHQVAACGLQPVVCAALWVLGRWDEVEEALRSIKPSASGGIDEWSTTILWAELHAGRGEFAQARSYSERFRTLLGTKFDERWHVDWANLESEILLWSGDAEAAVRRIEPVFGMEFDGELCCDDPSHASLMLNAVTAAARIRDRAAARTKVADHTATFARWQTEGRWGARGGPGELATVLRQVAAEAAVLDDHGDADEWAAIAEEWLDRYSLRPRAAYARWREAEVRVAVGDRAGATAAARAAHALAIEMGWQWVRDGVADLARRARLDLGDNESTVDEAASRAGLTPREAEVLRLVAAGRTNRQIGETLFISTKTASAHVSSLLMKLGVTNRGEAGAAAHRLGLA